jgi:AcrR family transcriptional regulator
MATNDPPAVRVSARDRLLASAEALFYEEGINAVGIDRVIAHAGVAKASLYKCFGSKEELVRSYVSMRHEARKARVLAGLERFKTPRDRLLGVFDLLGELTAQPNFRGCAFTKAGLEARSGTSVRSSCDESRAWLTQLFSDLAKAAGVAKPKELAQQYVMLYDGASIAAQMDGNPKAAAAARVVASAMLDSVAPSPRSKPPRRSAKA